MLYGIMSEEELKPQTFKCASVFSVRWLGSAIARLRLVPSFVQLRCTFSSPPRNSNSDIGVFKGTDNATDNEVS